VPFLNSVAKALERQDWLTAGGRIDAVVEKVSSDL
jgi:hypothetical protein